MFCSKCGKENPNLSTFCIECGEKLIVPPSPLVQPRPVNQTYIPSTPLPRPKKKLPIGRIVTLSILAILIGSILYFIGTLFWFPPKDLGVKYTKADFDSAVKKIGIVKDTAPLKGALGDYKYVYSGSKHLDVEFTQQELTAWLNEGRPSYFALKKVQIKLNKDGTAEASAEVNLDNVKYIVNKNIPNADWSSIPIPIPSKANIYVKSSGSVTNNIFSLSGVNANIGVAPIPGNLLTTNNVNVLEDTIKTVIEKEIPTTKIEKIELVNCKIHSVGTIPAKMERVKIK